MTPHSHMEEVDSSKRAQRRGDDTSESGRQWPPPNEARCSSGVLRQLGALGVPKFESERFAKSELQVCCQDH